MRLSSAYRCCAPPFSNHERAGSKPAGYRYSNHERAGSKPAGYRYSNHERAGSKPAGLMTNLQVLKKQSAGYYCVIRSI